MKYEVDNGRRVTEAALIERINKKLTEQSRDQKEIQVTGSPSIGHFYDHENDLADHERAIDLESIGRELGVLASDETVVY